MTDTEPAAEAASTEPPKRFGAFAGVFTPSLLTILGVMMYLRLGWVVGRTGLLGGWLILLLAIGIALATGLSLSSIATNTRLGAGGPYAIISKSLGFEVGGSIGLPLYLSQALATAMYVIGFREGWLWIFPEHDPLMVDAITFAGVFLVAYVSAHLAFRLQYLVMAAIAASLVVIFGNPESWTSTHELNLWGPPETPGRMSTNDFWIVFAVFFPAVTGFTVGANMSGEIRNPRRNIPLGTLAAIGVSAVIYLALAWFLAKAAPADELSSNFTVLIDASIWPPAVLAGLLGATVSSALSSLVGAPRVLQALARDEVIPASGWLARISRSGEPRRAMMVSGLVVVIALLLRDLNAVAPLITMFFLIAYAVINVVVLVESSLGLVSFRPTLRIPRIVPLFGAAGCIFTMFIVNPAFSLVAVGVVVAIYFWIIRTVGLRPKEDVRSGLFVAIAEWAAAKVIHYRMAGIRAWKPNLLVPVKDSSQLRGKFRLLADLCRPEGSVKLLGIAAAEDELRLSQQLQDVGRQLRLEGVFTTRSIIDATGYTTGLIAGMQALRSAFFRPNVLFLPLPADSARFAELVHTCHEARRQEIGVIVVAMHPKAGLGRARIVNLWMRPETLDRPIADILAAGNRNLAILVAFRLARAWGAELNLISVVPEKDQIEGVRTYIEEVRDVCRIPPTAITHVLVGGFLEQLEAAPQSDVDILGLQHQPEHSFISDAVKATRSTCLFMYDSGYESAMA